MIFKRNLLSNLLVLFILLFSQIPSSTVHATALNQNAANTISGRVTDGNGNGLAGVTILAMMDPLYIYLPNIIRSNTTGGTTGSNPPDSGQNYYTVETDSNGFYNLDTLPPGRYVISVRMTGHDFSPLSYSVNTTSGGSNFDFQEVIIPTIYTPGTITLSEATLAELLSVSDDGTTYTFASETSDLAQVNAGDVLIGGITTLTPNGFLRKVVSISPNGDQREVVTDQATLEDAFESLSVSTTQQLTTTQVQGLADTPGVTLSRAPAVNGLGDFEFALNNAVLFDKDGNLSTTDDQVIANGTLAVSPNIEFRIRIVNGVLEELFYTSTMSIQTGYTVSSKISFTIPLMEAYLIPTIHLGAIPVGPLWLTPTLDLVAGVTGSVFTGISTSITNTTSFTAGLWHVNGQTRKLSNFASNFSFSPPSSQSGLSFKAYVGPKASVKIYGVMGGYVKPGVAQNLTIAPASNPWLTLKGGLEVSVGVSVTVPIVNKDLLNIQLGAINHWVLLYSLSSSTRWKVVDSPTTTPLNGMALVAANNIWATGANPMSDEPRNSVVLHWNDSSWQSITTPTTTDLLSDIDFLSANDGWLVGTCRTFHWNGSSWTYYSSPSCHYINSVEMVASNDVWAVSWGSILHWNGSSWTISYSPADDYWLSDLDMVSSTDGWFVSNSGYIYRWNGTTWNFFQSTGVPLKAIDMLSDTDGWIVGNEGTILRWNGSTWNGVSSPVTSYLTDISMLSSNRGWIIGSNDSILMWDGSSWQQQISPSASLISVQAVSEDEAWAVGWNGAILHYSNQP